MNPLVSIIIPSYNMGQFIKEAIDSSLNQTFKDFEIIIGDNMSTDNTVNIINKYKDERIRLIKNSTNIGAIRNFNNLLKESRGKYVKFLEADDKLDSRCLEKLVCIFNKDDTIKMICTGKYFMDENSNVYRDHKVKKSYKLKSPYNLLRIINFGNEFGTPSDIIINKELVNEIGLFDIFYDKYLNDFDLWLRISFSKDIYVTSYISCYVRRHSQQMGAVGVKDNRDVVVMAKMYSKLCRNNFVIRNLLGTNALIYFLYRSSRSFIRNKNFKEFLNFFKILKINYSFFGVSIFILFPVNFLSIIIIKLFKSDIYKV